MLMVRARRVEDVDAVKQRVTGWMDRRYGNWKDRASVEVSAAVRLEQAATGMLIFKLMMGSFAGITLVVGGIGIMNVLLAAVTERTREIGIRRAIGARQRDIMTQFLSESVTISGVGSALGVVLGLGAAFALTALIRLKTDAPVHAAVTAQSLGVVALVAVAVGLLFGTYPALRAARLPPIEAIRHE
jgi:putative ABC transport system permease protein